MVALAEKLSPINRQSKNLANFFSNIIILL
jgi:hypothetical protein